MSEERRRFTRVSFNSTCVIFDGDRPHEARLLDISIKGALVETPDASIFNLNNPCDLKIALEGSDAALKLRCDIVHSENGRLGLYFTHTDVESLTHLRTLVALNMGDAEKTAKELFSWSES